MVEDRDDAEGTIAERVVGLHNVIYEEDLTLEEIDLYELTEDYYEGEIYLPHIGINYDLWEEWSTEKRVEVLIHEFAHAENYADDHHPSFWDRVVGSTEIAIDHRTSLEEVFDDPIDPRTLKRTVVDSIHEGVIESDLDSVPERKRAVAAALGVHPSRTEED